MYFSIHRVLFVTGSCFFRYTVYSVRYRVMYFSIHRYEHGRFWPNLRESDYDHIGEGKGRGYNVNVPFNKVSSVKASRPKVLDYSNDD